MSAPFHHSRRRFLVLGGAAAVALAGCGGDDDERTPGPDEISEEEAEADVAILRALLDMEYLSVTAYEAAADTLRGAQARTARRFGEHEWEHAYEIAAAIDRAGGRPAPRRPRREHEAGFPRLREPADTLAFLADVESTAIAAYIDGLPKVATPETRATLIRVVVTEAEHLSVLLGELERPRAPQAFVTGEQ